MYHESMFLNPQANTLSLSSSEVYLRPREAGEREEMRGRERGETTGTPSTGCKGLLYLPMTPS